MEAAALRGGANEEASIMRGAALRVGTDNDGCAKGVAALRGGGAIEDGAKGAAPARSAEAAVAAAAAFCSSFFFFSAIRACRFDKASLPSLSGGITAAVAPKRLPMLLVVVCGVLLYLLLLLPLKFVGSG